MARTKRKGNQNKQQPPAAANAAAPPIPAPAPAAAPAPAPAPANVPNQVTNKSQREDPASRIATLEEQVRLDELVLKELLDRRTFLGEEIETTRLKRQKLLERSVLLKERSLHLRAAKIKYTTLQKELQESLAKCRERLARLSSLEELGHEDVASCEISALIDDVQQSESNADDNKSIESAKGSLDGNGQPQVTIPQQHGTKANGPFPSASGLRSSPSVPVALYRDFCVRHRHPKSLMPFLPVVDSSLMSRILSMSMKEAKALDVIHKTPSARRCLFWNTCLDLALLSIIKIQPIDDDDDNNNNNGKGQKSTALDPNVLLCPYELTGICADDYCPYQHSSKPTLPREQIPLPLLSLQPSQENSAKGSAPPRASSRATTKRNEGGAKTSNGGTNAFDDFIALPKPDTDNESDESDTDSDDDFDCQGIFSLVAEGINESSSTFAMEGGGEIPSNDTSVEELFRSNRHDTFSSIFDAIRLSLHSGRFDVAHSLIERETQPAWWKDLLQEVWYDCFQSPSKNISFIRTIFQNQATLLVLAACGSNNDTDMKSLLKDVLENMWMPEMDSSRPVEFVISDFRNVLSGFHDHWKGLQPKDTYAKYADLRKSILWARKVFDRLSSSRMSLHRIDEQILKPCWWSLRRWVELLKPDEMVWAGIKGTIVMGLIVLGCLESFATFVHDDHLSTSIIASLINVDNTVYNILKGLSKLFACVPMLDILLSPLYAANVAAATFARQYSTAYLRLFQLLTIKSHHQHQRQPPGVMQFSELLWSQFLHLRMALPVALNSDLQEKKTTRSKRYPWELSPDVVSENQVLMEKLEKRGLRLLHVTLTGDRVFAHALTGGLSSPIDLGRAERLKIVASMIQEWVYVEVNQPGATSHSLGLTNLPLHPSAHRSESVMASTISSLPRSLMLIGHNLQELNLSQCQLMSLPATFGLYFPNLLNLNISGNLIETLPLSFRSMLCLEWLSLAGNRIRVLSGEEFMASLKYLDLSNNFLSQLLDIAECLGRRCFQLEELNISSNEISNVKLLQEQVLPRWSLQMKSLKKITWKPQGKAPSKVRV